MMSRLWSTSLRPGGHKIPCSLRYQHVGRAACARPAGAFVLADEGSVHCKTKASACRQIACFKHPVLAEFSQKWAPWAASLTKDVHLAGNWLTNVLRRALLQGLPCHMCGTLRWMRLSAALSYLRQEPRG